MVNQIVKPDSLNSVILPDRNDNEQSNIRILIADDQNMVRQKLRISLESEPNIEIVGSAEDGKTAIEQIELLRPDVALIDIEMPKLDGLSATQISQKRFANTKILILSSYDDREYINKALEAGAKGYLLKTTPATEMIQAIRFVNKGYLHLSPGLYEKIESRITVTESQDGQIDLSVQEKDEAIEVSVSSTEVLESPSGEDWSSQTKEMIDTLPQVWTRGLLYFLVFFMTVLLPWAMLSKVDETGAARGRIEPADRTMTLDAPVAGTVAVVKVKEGETVNSGQVLLKFEPEVARKELEQANALLEGQRNRAAQLTAVQNQLEISMRTTQQQNQAQESEQLANLNQIRQRLSSSQKVYAVEKNRFSAAKNDVERHQKLWQSNVIAKTELEEKQNFLMERQQILEQAQSEVQEASTELEKQQSAYESIKRAGELTVLDSLRQFEELQSQLVEARSEITQTKKQIQSLRFQLDRHVLRAPVNGTVFQLEVDSAGAVLQPGEPIAQVAPKGDPLIFRAQIPSTENGFLEVGMPVKLKFDAYPFQDYGIVPGQLRWISPDSRVEQTAQGNIEFFELEIELDRTHIEAQGKRIALTPGQTATAEVVIRQRRLIDFIIDPFKQLQESGLKL